MRCPKLKSLLMTSVSQRLKTKLESVESSVKKWRSERGMDELVSFPKTSLTNY